MTWRPERRKSRLLQRTFAEDEVADWDSPQAVKDCYASASLIEDNRVVVKINYPYRTVYVRFVGTHKECDGVDATEI